MRVLRKSVIVLGVVLAGSGGFAQVDDPRTAAGQLAVCGGAQAWQSVGYLEFAVEIEAGGQRQGPWRYRWDRRYNYFRISGPYPGGGTVDLALDVGSRSGGGSRDGVVLTGPALADAVNWAFTRFGEDVLWMTFPLEWGAAGVTVTPGPESSDASGRPLLTTLVVSPAGRWEVSLDKQSGRIVQTVVERAGAPKLTVDWAEWNTTSGVLFAGLRAVEETGENVRIDSIVAHPQTPTDAF